MTKLEVGGVTSKTKSKYLIKQNNSTKIMMLKVNSTQIEEYL